MKNFLRAFLTCTVFLTTQAHSQGLGPEQLESNPLHPFERLIGGQWHLEGSYQEFEWGIDRRLVKSRNYFIVEGKPKLVAEGMWFWHPGEKQIKGVFTGIDMPVLFFDYTTRFEKNKMINDLRAYDTNQIETLYVESWDFTDDSHYVWELSTKTPDGLQYLMGGTYTKR
jgi:hypothetical protein